MASRSSKNTQVTKYIVYGNTATKLQNEIPMQNGVPHTHRWTFFIKPYYEEDLSVFIRKIEFTLDKSFENPVREVFAPPYEITETGWGEFDIAFKIYFKEKTKPVDYWHYINLYPAKNNLKIDERTVLVECFDVMVFPKPKKNFRALLESGKSSKINRFRTDFDRLEKKTIKVLQEGSNKVEKEIKEVNERIEDMKRKVSILTRAWQDHETRLIENDQLTEDDDDQLSEDFDEGQLMDKQKQKFV